MIEGKRLSAPPGAKSLAGLTQAGQPFLAAHGVELAAGVLPNESELSIIGLIADPNSDGVAN